MINSFSILFSSTASIKSALDEMQNKTMVKIIAKELIEELTTLKEIMDNVEIESNLVLGENLRETVIKSLTYNMNKHSLSEEQIVKIFTNPESVMETNINRRVSKLEPNIKETINEYLDIMSGRKVVPIHYKVKYNKPNSNFEFHYDLVDAVDILRQIKSRDINGIINTLKEYLASYDNVLRSEVRERDAEHYFNGQNYYGYHLEITKGLPSLKETRDNGANYLKQVENIKDILDSSLYMKIKNRSTLNQKNLSIDNLYLSEDKLEELNLNKNPLAWLSVIVSLKEEGYNIPSFGKKIEIDIKEVELVKGTILSNTIELCDLALELANSL